MFGPETTVGLLRASLGDQSTRHREVGVRVANFMTPEQASRFAANLNQEFADIDQSERDLQREMVELADTSMRYDVAARLLRRVYDSYRTALRNG